MREPTLHVDEKLSILSTKLLKSDIIRSDKALHPNCIAIWLFQCWARGMLLLPLLLNRECSHCPVTLTNVSYYLPLAQTQCTMLFLNVAEFPSIYSIDFRIGEDYCFPIYKAAVQVNDCTCTASPIPCQTWTVWTKLPQTYTASNPIICSTKCPAVFASSKIRCLHWGLCVSQPSAWAHSSLFWRRLLGFSK